MVRFFNMLQECGLDIASDIVSWMNEQRKTIVAFFKTLKDRFENIDDDLQKIRDSLPNISQLPEIPDFN